MQDATKQVIEALKPVAEKIGEGAAHLYEIYVRQMLAEAYATLAGIAIAAILLVVLLVIMSKVRKRNDDSDVWFFTVAVQTVVSVVLFLTLVFGIPANIMKAVNPEYYAIERLLCQVKGDTPC